MELENSSPRPIGIQETIGELSKIDASLAIHTISNETLSKLNTIINKLGSERLSLNTQISNLQDKVKLEKSEKNELEQLKNRVATLGKAQVYAHKIQKKVETLEASNIRGMHKEDIRKNVIEQTPMPFLIEQSRDIARNIESDVNKKLEAYGIGNLEEEEISTIIEKLEKDLNTNPQNQTAKELLEVVKNLEAFNNLPKISEKFSRSSVDMESRDLSSQDLHHLKRILVCLDSMKNETKELSQLYDSMVDMHSEFSTTFEKGVNFLLKLDPQGETMNLLREIQQQHEPQSDIEEMRWFRKASELHWEFNDPFESHIGQKGIAEILLDALDGKENHATALVSRLDDNQKKELREKATLLKDTAAQIKNITTETGNKPKFRAEILNIKKEFLKEKRIENLKKEIPVSINIVGGGPGGIMRAMIAAVKGQDATVIEMRESYSRDNMVKINDSIVLKYFGVKERLAEKGLIDPEKTSIEVSIKNLEYILNEIAIEIYGNEDFRLRGQVVDILAGSNGKAACLIQEGERNGPTKSSVREADLIVDSTGARGHVGSMMGVSSEQFATSQMMVALVMNGKNTGKGKNSGNEFSASIPLSAPNQNYSLIQPSVENQSMLRELNNQKSELQKKENQFQSQIKKFEKAIEKSNLPKAEQSSNINFPELYRENIESYLPRNSVEDLKLLWGEKTSDYDIELLKEAKRYAPRLTLERKSVETELEKLLYKIASDQQAKKLVKGRDVIQIAPFNIEIHQRDQPSIVYGNSVVMFSGDSLATPDPKSGAGVGHALSGGTLFSKALDDKSRGATPEQIQARFNLGSQIQMDQVTMSGITARQQIASEDPGLTPTFILKEAGKYGFVTEQEINFLMIVNAKKEYGGIISDTDEWHLIEIENNIKSIKVLGSLKVAILEGLKGLIAKNKSGTSAS